MRTNGMGMHKLPLFVWSIYVTAILLLLSLPILAGSFEMILEFFNKYTEFNSVYLTFDSISMSLYLAFFIPLSLNKVSV
jgi:heme/copper-type cytochrome/quinol oxidase subunit 1